MNKEIRRNKKSSGTNNHELYDYAPGGYLTLTAEGIIAEINYAGVKLLGGERQAIINKGFEGFIDDKYKEDWHRYFLLAKQQDSKRACSLQLRLTDGTGLNIKINRLCMMTAKDDPKLYLVLTETTAREQAEVKLRVSNLALKTITQGVIVSDFDGRILSVNEAFTKITGYSEPEILGRTCNFLQGALTDSQSKEAIRQAMKTNSEFSGEILNYRKDGTIFWNDMVISPVVEAGQVTHYIGITRDISERKNTESELRIAAAAFETEEGMIVADSNKVILRVNNSFCDITGYTAEEVVGKPLTIFRSGQHVESFYESLWTTVASAGYWEGELWNRHKNGNVYPAWQIITAVSDANAIVTHNVVSFRDISAQKQAEKVLLDARQRLENQVVTSKAELEKIQQETNEINAVLNVLIKHRETDIAETKATLSHEVESTIFPFLKKLKKVSTDRVQTVRLLEILEANLKHLVQSYGHPHNLLSAYRELTPVELQVASMVRQGLSTKAIAATLSSSAETVSIHRKHIRKKLGLGNKTDNLRSYLLSLAE